MTTHCIILLVQMVLPILHRVYVQPCGLFCTIVLALEFYLLLLFFLPECLLINLSQPLYCFQLWSKWLGVYVLMASFRSLVAYMMRSSDMTINKIISLCWKLMLSDFWVTSSQLWLCSFCNDSRLELSSAHSLHWSTWVSLVQLHVYHSTCTGGLIGVASKWYALLKDY